MSKSLQPKYRSRSLGQGICRGSTFRRSSLQGLMVIGLIVEKISNVDAKCVKVTGAQNIGQLRVSTSMRSTMQGLVVVCLIVEKIWNINVNCVKVNGAQNIGQGHWVNIPAKSGGQGDVSCKV